MNLQSYQRFRSAFAVILGDLTALAVRREFSGLGQAVEALERRVAEERFFVAVLGEIKRGKSTLINAILGRDILPKAALICTAVPCLIRFGETPKAILHFRDGTRRDIDPDDLKAHVTRRNSSAAHVAECEIEYPLPLLADGVVMVDTPGVNDTDELRRRLTEECIPRADGVLFVLNAGQPFTDSEMRFLTSSVLKHHVRKFWFVVTAMDRLGNPADQAEALEYCRSHLAGILPAARLHGISAKAYLEALAANDQPGRVASGLPGFLDDLSTDLVTGRLEGLLHVPLGQAIALCEHLDLALQQQQQLLATTEHRAQEQAESIRVRAASLFADAQRELDRFAERLEALTFEVIPGFAPPGEEGLGEAACRILALDDTDERKTAELNHLVHDRIQAYLDRLADLLHQNVGPLAQESRQNIERLAAQAGQVLEDEGFALPPRRGGTDDELPPPADWATVFTTELPDTGLQKQFMVSGFGRLASLAFLVQGNILLAAVSLAGSFATGLNMGLAGRLVPHLRTCLREGAQTVRDRFVTEKTTIAAAYRRQLATIAAPSLAILEELASPRPALCPGGNHERERQALQADRQAVRELMQRLAALRREYDL
jgi:GTPase SAR1 family protein